jgi:hypothetical protein
VVLPCTKDKDTETLSTYITPNTPKITTEVTKLTENLLGKGYTVQTVIITIDQNLPTF